jgi:diketogulonate reductase-like aldo/keto reductase
MVSKGFSHKPRLDCVDLCLVHWPIAAEKESRRTIRYSLQLLAPTELPKSSNLSRIDSNLKSIVLSDESFEATDQVADSRHFRFVNMKDTFGL